MQGLVAIPVYNEERQIGRVLELVLQQGHPVLVVDDGSTDGTAAVLDDFPEVRVVRHTKNRGYGAALQTAFQYGREGNWAVVVTMDSDGQHAPGLIPQFLEAAQEWDIVSGSRYLEEFTNDTPAPIERRRINQTVTDLLNARLGLNLTDAFCGFKAYRVAALGKLSLTEDGYAMPLELWVQAACHRLSIREIAVPRIYLDPNRSFGETLDDADRRLAYYQEVLDRAIEYARRTQKCGQFAARVG